MKKRRWSLAWLWACLLFFSAASSPSVLIGAGGKPETGFMVLSNGSIYNYVYNGDKTFTLKSTATAKERFEHYATCSGSLYSFSPLMGDIVRLDGNLKEAAHVNIKSGGGITEFLGCNDGRLFFLADNAVSVLDAGLQTLAVIALSPEARDGIFPQLAPVDFDTFEGRGYLLVETGDIFVLDVAGRRVVGAVRIAPDDATAPETVRALWLDQDQGTLNVLARKRSETHDAALAAGESRITETETVYTYRLAAMTEKPVATSIYEKRQIYKPYSAAFLDYLKQQNDKGVIVDPIPPYRSDGAPTGNYIGSLSRLIPCVARVFSYNTSALFSEPGFAILKSAGALQPLEVFREDKAGVLWFKVEGKIFFMADDDRQGLLNIYPHTLYYLLDEPVMKATGTRFLAY